MGFTTVSARTTNQLTMLGLLRWPLWFGFVVATIFVDAERDSENGDIPTDNDAVTFCQDELCRSVSFPYAHPDVESKDLEHIGRLNGYFMVSDLILDFESSRIRYVFRRNASLTGMLRYSQVLH